MSNTLFCLHHPWITSLAENKSGEIDLNNGLEFETAMYYK
jgi:hypothetical protein